MSLQKCIEEAKRNVYTANGNNYEHDEEYEDDKCEHKWIFQRSDFKKEKGGLDKYQRIDTYFCEKCLEIRELVSKEGKGAVEPYWFNPMVRIQRF